MSYGYAIDPSRRFIFQQFRGRFSVGQIIDCAQRIWSAPGYSKSYPGIVDISQMEPGAALDDLRPLVAFLKCERETTVARWAVITASPITTAGAMVYKRAMASRHPFEVFSTWESACGYLQLDLPRPPEPTFKIVFHDTASPAAL